MANLSNINNKFLFTDGDFLKIGNSAPINNISGTESGISITNGNCASITLDNSAAQGKTFSIYSAVNGSLNFFDVDAASGRLVIDTSGNATFAGDVQLGGTTPTLNFYKTSHADILANIKVESDTGTGGKLTIQTKRNGNTALDALVIYENQNSTFTGNVGIGTTSPNAQLEISNPNATSGAGGATLRLTRVDSTSVAGDPVGTIEFYSTDADTPKTTAYIKSMSEELYGRQGSLAFGVSQSINANATEAMRINSSGEVGIGTTSPSQRLHVVGNIKTFGHIFLQSNANGFRTVALDTTDGADNQELYLCGGGTASSSRGGQVGVYGNEVSGTGGSVVIVAGNVSTGDIDFLTANTQRMTINNAGNVGIGLTNPSWQLEVSDTGTVRHAITSTNNGTAGVFFRVFNSGTQVGNGTIATQNNGDMKFFTGTSGETERMRITSGGQIEIRNGSTVAGQLKASGADNDLAINGKRGQVIFEIADVQKAVLDANQFYPAADNGLNLGTTFLRFSTVYATNGVNTSDETLKENIKECNLGIDFIDSLKPKSYNFKDLKEDNDSYGKKRYGLIAQDILQTELKDSVFGKKDGEYGLSYNDLIAPMVKAIQELKADNDSLKARIETLENN